MLHIDIKEEKFHPLGEERPDMAKEFPFSLVVYATPVILRSSTRFPTREAAEEAAMEMLAGMHQEMERVNGSFL